MPRLDRARHNRTRVRSLRIHPRLASLGLIRGEKIRALLTEEERLRQDPDIDINQWPKYAERFVTPVVEAEIAVQGAEILPFLDEESDVLIWHSRLMHRGSVGTPGVRRKSLITHYSGINHRPDIVSVTRDENDRAYAAFEVPQDID